MSAVVHRRGAPGPGRAIANLPRQVQQWAYPADLGDRQARRRTVALTALLVGLVVGITWFQAGHFFASGDVGPLYRNGARSEFGSLWSHQGTGAGAPMYDVTRATELALGTLAGWLGGGAPLAERLLFSSMFAFAAGGSAALVGRFTERRWVVVAAGVLGAFNLLAVSGLPNYLPIVATGVAGFLMAFAIDAARGEHRPWLAAALVTVPLAYMANNPPLIAVMAGVVVALPLVGAALTGTGLRGAGRVGRWLVQTALLALPLALYWIVPEVLSIRSAVSGGAVTAQTDVTGWSWTHRNNSLANVLTMRSFWTWPEPIYHGVAGEALGSRALTPLSWLLPMGVPVAALLAPRARRRMVWWSTLALMVLVFLGKGLHAPLRGLNLAMYRSLPGFWLLREPMSKLGFLVVLLLLVLWVVAVDGLVVRFGAAPRRTGAVAAWREGARVAGCGLLVAGPLLLTWPMVTGAVTHDVKAGAAEQVVVPAGWKELATMVNGSATRGKVLVLPLADFYQMPTTWGYYGTDNLANGLFTRPVITRNVDGYIGDATAYRQIVEATQQAVLAGRADRALALMRVLGATQLVVRTDFDRDSPVRRVEIADPEAMLAALRGMSGLHVAGSTSVGTVLEPDDGGAGTVQLASELFASTFRPLTLGAQAATVAAEVALTDDARAHVTGQLWAEEVGTSATISTDAAVVRVQRDGGGTGHYWATVEDRAEGRRLVLRDAAPVSLGEQVISSLPELAVAVDGEVLGVSVGERLVPFADGMVVDVPAGADVRPVLVAGDSALGGFGPLTDCNRVDARSAADAGITSADLTDGDASILQLGASAHRACRAAPFVAAAVGATYQVEIAARSLSGAGPAACLWADGPQLCVALPEPQDVDGWQVRRGLVTLPEGTTAARLFLYADGRGDGTATVTQYRLPKVLATSIGGPAGAADGTATVPAPTEYDLTAGNYELSAPAVGSVRLSGWAAVGDCHRSDERSLADVGISMTPADPSGPAAELELTAQAHSACTSADVGALSAGEVYELRFEHRNSKGRAPRVCVYDRTARRCLQVTANGQVVTSLPAGLDWAQAQLVFTAPDGGAAAGQVQVFLYADGTEAGTVVGYRSVSVAPRSHDVVTIQTAQTSGPPPSMDWERRSSSEYTIRVDAASAPFVLTLAETYSDRWRLVGPDGEDLAPVKVNGYANGWTISDTGDMVLTVRYTPDLWARRAIVVSLGGLVVLTFLIGIRLMRAGPARRATRSAAASA